MTIEKGDLRVSFFLPVSLHQSNAEPSSDSTRAICADSRPSVTSAGRTSRFFRYHSGGFAAEGIALGDPTAKAFERFGPGGGHPMWQIGRYIL